MDVWELPPVEEMDAAELQAELKRLTATAPPAFARWNYAQVIEFKALAARGVKLVRERSTRVDFLRPAVKLLRQQWA
jgi:hypothetical protein